MQLYKCHAAEDHQFVNHVEQSDYEILWQAMKNRNKGEPWLPPKVQIIHVDDDGLKLEQSDLLGLEGRLSERAVWKLQDILEKNGEILPLNEISGCTVYLFLPDRVDALDMSKAEVKLFPGSTRVMMVKRYSFHEGAIAGRDVFRLHQDRGGEVYFYSQRFVDRVNEAGLRGFVFELVYDSGGGVLNKSRMVHPSQVGSGPLN